MFPAAAGLSLAGDFPGFDITSNQSHAMQENEPDRFFSTLPGF
jgi:hypothetical protein